MKGGFNDRVDKVFGSISSSSSSWSLTDAPVEKREWNHRRDTENDRDDDQIPVFFSSSSSSETENIRSSIGLDPTLDHEEEEDAYDKMAQGTEEDCSHRLYMKDVDDHGPFLNSHNLLPKSIHHPPPAAPDDEKTSLNDAATAAPPSEDNKIKSILKKRKTCDVDVHDDDHELAKPIIAPAKCKRVRFDSTCKNVVDEPPHPEPTLVVSQNRPAVPDYILNPSKYTRYTFDDGSCNPSDFLEESSSKHSAAAAAAALERGELPKVVFIPRKKRGDNNNEDEHVRKQSSTIDIAAVEVQHQEDEEESHDVDENVCTKPRPVRQYRSKIDDYDDDDAF